MLSILSHLQERKNYWLRRWLNLTTLRPLRHRECSSLSSKPQCLFPYCQIQSCFLNTLYHLFLFFPPCRWYEWWEKSGFFVADPKSKKPPFVIVRFCSITSELGFFPFQYMEFQDYQDLVNFRIYKSGVKAFIYWLWFMNRLCHHQM